MGKKVRATVLVFGAKYQRKALVDIGDRKWLKRRKQFAQCGKFIRSEFSVCKQLHFVVFFIYVKSKIIMKYKF